MKSLSKVVVTVLCLAVVTGCAYTSIRPVAPGTERHHSGFVMYDPMVVMIVTAEDVRFEVFGNPMKPRVANQYSFLAVGSYNFKLHNGTLSEGGSSADSTAIIPTLAAFLSPDGGAARTGTSELARVMGLTAGVYDLVFDEAGCLLGFRKLHEYSCLPGAGTYMAGNGGSDRTTVEK